MNRPRAGFSLTTHASDETQTLGEFAGAANPQGLTICLYGDLGAGKTVFVRGLARGFLGEHTVAVTSPTYVLQHVYTHDNRHVYHIDAYRLGGPDTDDECLDVQSPCGADEFEAAGLNESLRDPDGVVCIEWAQRVGSLLPEDRVEIEIEHLDPTQRELRILATGPKAAAYVDRLVRMAGSRERLLHKLGRGGIHPPREAPSGPVNWS